MLLTCCTQYARKFGKLSSGHRTGKGQFSFQSYRTIALISQASKVMLESKASKVCELWTSRCSSWIYKMQRNQKSNCQHLLDHWKSRRVLEKHLLLLYWLPQSLWQCRSQQTVILKFLKRWEYQITWPASWEICMQVKKQQLELDMEQQTGFTLGKE